MPSKKHENPSPFKVANDKWRLYPYIKNLIEHIYGKPEDRPLNGKDENIVNYTEPFSGSFSIGFELGTRYIVNFPTYNDVNSGFKFAVRYIVMYPDEFIKLMYKTPVTIEEYRKQKETYLKYKYYHKPGLRQNEWKKYGFATFYLNHTNVKGDMGDKTGPIGGYDQSGKHKIDYDFTKEKKDVLARKIEVIGDFHNPMQISLSFGGADVLADYADESIWMFKATGILKNRFFFVDPPYYDHKPHGIYDFGMNEEDHRKLAEKLKRLDAPFVLLYNDCPEIRELYKDFPIVENIDMFKKRGNGITTDLLISNIKREDFVWTDKEE